MALLFFWSVLALVALGVALLSRVYSWAILALGFGCAAVLAWLDGGILYQLAVAVVLSGLGFYLKLRAAPPKYLSHKEAVASRMSEHGTLSTFSTFSTFGNPSDEVMVHQWTGETTLEAVYKGKLCKAVLASGVKAKSGRYKVREIQGRQLILEEW
jgi:fluoride ion exporter CrcB/FEX